VEKFCDGASEPLAILKFDSAMGRSSIGNFGAEVRTPIFAFDSRAAGARLKCPLYRHKRTFGDASGMSALCQKRTLHLTHLTHLIWVEPISGMAFKYPSLNGPIRRAPLPHSVWTDVPDSGVIGIWI
jgi:hypothetical protein